MTLRPPAPRPCESCPYRRDVPSGVWSEEEYDKLRDFDDQHGPRMMRLFQCHQVESDNPAARLCAGWTAVHGGRSIGLRLAVSSGAMDRSVLGYESPVPLFESGAEAADHGQEELLWPSEEAVRLAAKIVRRRDDIEVES